MQRLFYVFMLVVFVLTSCGKVEIKQTENPNDGKDDASVNQDGYDIFLLIGQSNMAGRGILLREDTISSIDGVFLLNGKDEPEPARCPLNKHSSIRKDYSMQQMNPGYAFSKKIYEVTGRKVLLVCNARGGTAMSSWLPESSTSNYFSEAVRRTKKAMKYGKVKGILWHQGCGDSGQESLRAVYLDRLKLVAETLRKEFKDNNIYFVAGELAYWRSSSPQFNEIIRTISQKITFSDYISAEGCDMLKDSSDPHFGRQGQLLLGERYADKVLKAVYGVE